MFTGLVLGPGTLRSRDRRGPGFRLVIGSQGVSGFDDLSLGESVSVNGACLTVVAHAATSFEADISEETAEKTTLGGLLLGSELNLERALRVGDRLGGHMLSGHVDGVASVKSVDVVGDAWRVQVAFSEPLRRFVAVKGSIALDGVSLTVNEVTGNTLSVALIPHTRKLTNLKHLRTGSELNLEVDLLARYLVNYCEATGKTPAEVEHSGFALALERAGYK